VQKNKAARTLIKFEPAIKEKFVVKRNQKQVQSVSQIHEEYREPDAMIIEDNNHQEVERANQQEEGRPEEIGFDGMDGEFDFLFNDSIMINDVELNEDLDLLPLRNNPRS